MSVRTRGREVFTAVTDPNNNHITYGGLSFGRLNPGQAATCNFTVSHNYIFWPWGGAHETFSGVVLGPDGLVILRLTSDTVTLTFGKFTPLSLFSLGPVPASLGGQTITAVVGPAILFSGVFIGQPFSSADTLSATALVPAQVSGPPTIRPPSSGLGQIALYVAGGAALLGGAVVAVRLKHQREEMTG